MRLVFLIVILILITPLSSLARKKIKYRKTQEVNFDGTNIDGEVRSPDGAYLHQKRGVKFLPLYKIKKEFDKNIRSSVDYLR